ncbi:hypothetical protein M885DRAFT_621306, partial [Pelagophyceae sp. CCMP2097]
QRLDLYPRSFPSQPLSRSRAASPPPSPPQPAAHAPPSRSLKVFAFLREGSREEHGFPVVRGPGRLHQALDVGVGGRPLLQGGAEEEGFGGEAPHRKGRESGQAALDQVALVLQAGPKHVALGSSRLRQEAHCARVTATGLRRRARRPHEGRLRILR